MAGRQYQIQISADVLRFYACGCLPMRLQSPTAANEEIRCTGAPTTSAAAMYVLMADLLKFFWL